MATPLADRLFNPDGVAELAGSIHRVWPQFPVAAFVERVNGRLMSLRLKERIALITACLADALPADFRDAVTILRDALPPPCDPALTDGDFGDFIYAPVSAYVADHGCTRTDLTFSLDALRDITTRFSAEDAIRPFINAFPEQTLATLLRWTDDPHYHVRRLASEGTRPLLPWARRLTVPAMAGLPILDALADDPTRFVTRSVANHLNDISKVHPEVTVATLERWRADGRNEAAELAYVTRHATRTLIKSGHAGAMALLGVSSDHTVELVRLDTPASVALGGNLDFTATVTSAVGGEAIVDYAVTFQDVRGRMSRRRVFKLRRLTLGPGDVAVVGRSHPFRADRTTFRVYPGPHRLEILANGRVLGSCGFDVVA